MHGTLYETHRGSCIDPSNKNGASTMMCEPYLSMHCTNYTPSSYIVATYVSLSIISPEKTEKIAIHYLG